MGLDFIQRAAPSYRKGLDRRRIELGTPHLFTQQPSGAPRSYAAIVRNGHELRSGEEICVRLDDSRQVLAIRGLDPVAVFKSPPEELIEALVASHGEACGVVREVHDMAHTAEIDVC